MSGPPPPGAVYCERGHWRLEQYKDTEESYRAKMLTALTCPDYELSPPPSPPPPPDLLWRVDYGEGRGEAHAAPTPEDVYERTGNDRIFPLPDWAEPTVSRAHDLVVGGRCEVTRESGTLVVTHRPGEEKPFAAMVNQGRVVGTRACYTLGDALWFGVQWLEPQEPSVVQSSQPASPE